MLNAPNRSRRPSSRTLLARTALSLAGSLFSLSLLAGCENRQVAVIFPKGRSETATALGAYYKLNEPTFRSAGIRKNLDRFGIEAMLGTVGDLEVQVFSYANEVPCSLNSGSGTVRLPGEYRQNLTIDLATTTQTCAGAAEPVDFPKQNLAVWARAANDIWVVGDEGKILRWNGEVYSRVPLPANLTSFPPTWYTAVGTVRGEIIIAGSNGNVVRWNPNTSVLESLNVSPPTNGAPPVPLTWRSASASLPSQGDVYLAGTSGLIGYYNPAFGNFITPFYYDCLTVPYPDINDISCTAVTLTNGSTLPDCWSVANSGLIMRATDSRVTGKTCAIVPSSVTANLRGVWVGANAAASRLDVRVVGDRSTPTASTILRSTMTIGATPPLPTAFMSYAPYLPPGFVADLTAVGSAIDANGNTTAQVWVSGRPGVVLRWDDSPLMPGSTIPFSLINTRLQSNFQRLSAMANGVVTTGPGPALFYAGSLFNPTN